MEKKPLLLIIDDEPAILQTLQEVLEDESYRVKTLQDGRRALEVIGELVPDVVFLDIFMPHCNGLDLLALIKKEYPSQKVIMISGFGNIPLAMDAIKRGARDFIEKPINLDEVLEKLESLCLMSQVKDTSEHQDEHTNMQHYGIIGQSSLFLEFMGHIRQTIPLKTPLLLYGAHGTGKTLMAEYVYHMSHQQGAMVVVNSSTLVSGFYHDLMAIDQGFIIIKNIDELSFDMQRDLLRFMQDSSYQEKNEKGYVRIIATASRSLYQMVVQQLFSPSLFHKINITPIELVPLSKRRYDIPLLADFFLHKANKTYKKNVVFSAEALRFLRNFQWNGNITELRRCVENIVRVVAYDATVGIYEIQSFLGDRKKQFVEEQSFLHFNSLQEATEQFERTFLSYRLKKERFDLAQASANLKISQQDLEHKISKLDIHFN